MKCVLFTTTILTSKSIDFLTRLHESVRHNSEIGTFNIVHVLLIQNPDQLAIPNLEETSRYKLLIKQTSTKHSLSDARNKMLQTATTNELISPEDIVAFPDDDCWYPGKSLYSIYSVFEKYASIGLLFCKYRSCDHESLDNVQLRIHKASGKDVVRNASSNTIFIRGGIVNGIGSFDENLGVGAIHNGGEDLDYALRAYHESEDVLFLDKYIIGHRDKIKTLMASYYRGSAIVLFRNMFMSGGLFLEAVRKFMIGCFYVLKGDMHIKEIWTAIRAR
ncbi:hypothetical protein [Agaribacter flavus]|uniref:Glycosyltransferase 2-like domain-containing protein n=1 Tax=Agaribacter flavus TaxID=1902781 RepID=A0ABV7FLV2_9ALTE